MSTVDKNLYKVGDLVMQFRGRRKELALVIEKSQGMFRYRIKWCRTGEAIWVWGHNLTPAY